MRVLLVEDSLVYARRVRGLLDSVDILATHVTTLADAQKCLAASPSFDCVILDRNLPDSDQEHSVKNLRAFWDGPLLVLSGNQQGDDHEKCLSKEIEPSAAMLRASLRAAVSEHTGIRLFRRPFIPSNAMLAAASAFSLQP